MVVKQKGLTCGGYCCKHCQGFWRANRGWRLICPTGGTQLILDEPPHHLYRAGSVAAWSTTSAWRRWLLFAMLPWKPINSVARMHFTKEQGLHEVLNAIWEVILSNPELKGLREIHKLTRERAASAPRLSS